MLSSPEGLKTRLAAVSTVGFLTYAGEYISYLIILDAINDKLLIGFHLGDLTTFLVGLISALYLIVSGLLAIPLGHQVDKYGRRRFTILGSTLGGTSLCFLIALTFASSLTVFAIGVALVLLGLGFGHATYTASTWAYVGDIARAGNIGKSYGLLELAEYAAYSFGPAIGGVIAFTVGRVDTFAISAVLLFSGAGIATALMTESSRFRAAGPRASVAVAAAGGSFGGGQDDLELQEHTVRITWKDFISVIRNPVVAATLLTTLVMSLALQGFYIYVPLFAFGLKSTIPVVAALAPALASVAAGTSVAMMMPFGVIADRTSRRMPQLVTGLMVGSFSLLMVFFVRSLPYLVTAAFVFGVALAMARVSQAVILAEGSALENRAAVMGTNHAIEHTGYGIGALVGGTLITALGIGTTFLELALVLVVCAVGFLIFAFRRKLR